MPAAGRRHQHNFAFDAFLDPIAANSFRHEPRPADIGVHDPLPFLIGLLFDETGLVGARRDHEPIDPAEGVERPLQNCLGVL